MPIDYWQKNISRNELDGFASKKVEKMLILGYK